MLKEYIMTTSAIIVAVSLLLFFLSVAIITYRNILKRDNSDGWGLFAWVIGIVSLVFGLIVLPLTLIDHKQYQEISNCQVLESGEAIILDMTNSPNKPWNELKKFNSYRAVTNIGDSTKFFEEKHKSFYGVTVNSYIVWSNPPYREYNRE